MKKLIYTIGMLMMLSGALGQVFEVSGARGEEEDCGDMLDDQAGLNSECYFSRLSGNKNTDWGQRFGEMKAEDAAKDLYLMIYQKTTSNPNKDAIEMTAKQYGMTAQKMSAILGGNINPIFEGRPGMQIDMAQKMYEGMIAAYHRNLTTTSTEATVRAKVEPNEIFANGDLKDSGFDLINDLNNIEIILFKKHSPTTVGGQAPNNASGSSQNDASPNRAPATPTAVSNATPAITPAVTALNPQGYQNANTNAANSLQGADSSGAAGFNPWLQVGGINPNMCFAGDSIADAINDFDAGGAAQAGRASTSGDPRVPAAPTPADGTNPGQGDSASGQDRVGAGQGIDTDNVSAGNRVGAAAAGDWRSPEICNDILCINLEFIKTQAVASYQKSDNCIACHVEYINKSLDETIKHNLIPSKATGNFGESTLCKDAMGTALGNVGMNFALTIVPVVTPSKDDLMTLGNITDEFEEYASRNAFWEYSVNKRRELEARKNNAPIDKSPIMTAFERQTIMAASEAASTARVQDVWQSTTDSVVAETTYQVQEAKEYALANQGFGAVDTYQILRDEMIAMNAYFMSMQKIMNSLLVDVPGMNSSKACTELKEKQQCT